MTRGRSGYALPLTLLSLLVVLAGIFLRVLSMTDIGNLLGKSSYAEWSAAIERTLTAQRAEVLLVDFGAFPDRDHETYVVVEIKEPTYEFEIRQLVLDVNQIIIEKYLQSKPLPPAVDYVLVAVVSPPDLRYGVRSPFQAGIDYVQGALDREAYLGTWEFGVEIGAEIGH